MIHIFHGFDNFEHRRKCRHIMYHSCCDPFDHVLSSYQNHVAMIIIFVICSPACSLNLVVVDAMEPIFH